MFDVKLLQPINFLQPLMYTYTHVYVLKITCISILINCLFRASLITMHLI
ncbi:hypothetical protein WN944_021220 [Citrus x changshan-huyou]|uniref:Uncharacterized protein n=1 Tax=Citrus x changshan-huyou TaxID=2935761 RepID=A0AAP0R2L2_9ROSI